MEDLYPANPADVPADLTKPTSAYRLRAWMAMAGLALFVVLYFALTYWFAHTAWRLLSGALHGGNDSFWGFVAGLCATFLTVFMAKAIFFVKHAYQIDDIEVTPQEQPQLFAFLNRLADDAGAPRPHRVFLSPRVNAAVFYDLSIVNLFWPSKKNLELGLPLVNALTLGELKAVLAHEFGHFAQRSMAVGRWVYIAQQIAGHIIAKRDALDKFLDALSRIDLRFAWVGWLLRLVVWSIRSVMETTFRVVVLAQRALSREMEFQADLVAVSLTGSDAIVHALHRLNVADTAWDRAAQFAVSQAQGGKIVRDVFAAQDLVIEKLRTIWDSPSFRDVSPPETAPEKYRVFRSQLAQPPRMWSTHPSNDERENNAKRTYIRAAIDRRSAWELFCDRPAVRERLSAHIVRKAVKDKNDVQTAALDESLAKLGEQYSRAYLQPRYRGAYLGRSIARHAPTAEALYEMPGACEGTADELARLYPETLSADLDQLRQLESEKAALQALYDGFLTAPGGIIRHGGKELRRRDLPAVIETVVTQLEAVESRVHAHDKLCRSAHLAAAEKLGRGWKEYLRGLAQLYHYAEHSEANLRDAQRVLHNVYAVATVGGRVSKRDVDRLLDVCVELHQVLRHLDEERNKVELDPTIARRIGVENWPTALEEFKLPLPLRENIGQWLGVIDGWVNGAAGALSTLRLAALEQLLLAEAQIGDDVRNNIQPSDAPTPSRTPEKYAVLLSGGERKRQTRLDWWDRFRTADGLVPSLARLAVAAVIIIAVVSVGGSVGTSSVFIYNGLDREVRVHIADGTTNIQPFRRYVVDVGQREKFSVSTTTNDGRVIESFDVDATGGFTHYIYNVAGASPLVEWTAVYGVYPERPERLLGAVRWTTSSVDHVFEEPPKSISTKGGGGERTVLTAVGNQWPGRLLQLLKTDAEKEALIAAHARWDTTESKHALYWLSVAMSYPATASILTERLQTSPLDPLLLRIEQDTSVGNAAAGGEQDAETKARHAAVCNRHRELAAAHPGDPNLVYVATRCIENQGERDRAFIAAYQAAPNNAWLALAAGFTYAESARWKEALPLLQQARSLAPATTDLVTTDIARIRRILMDRKMPLTDLYDDGGNLRLLDQVDRHSLDPKQANSPDVSAYVALADGNLELAIARSHGTESQARIIRLVGASTNATKVHIEAALALAPTSGVDDDTAWTAYALAVREHQSVAALRRAIDGLRDRDTEATLAFIDGIANGPMKEAERSLDGVMPRMRGQAYAAAAVLLGDKCPGEWKLAAQELLFAPERPFL